MKLKTQIFSKRLLEKGVSAKSIVFPTVTKVNERSSSSIPTVAHIKEMIWSFIYIWKIR